MSKEMTAVALLYFIMGLVVLGFYHLNEVAHQENLLGCRHAEVLASMDMYRARNDFGLSAAIGKSNPRAAKLLADRGRRTILVVGEENIVFKSACDALHAGKPLNGGKSR